MINKVDIESFKVRRNKVNQWDAEYNKDFKLMYDRLMLVAMSVFEWEGLPETVDPIFLERTLARYGSICFFEDEMLDYLETGDKYFVLNYMGSYKRNIYGEPIVRRVYTAYENNYRKTVTYKDSVLIYDNVLKMSIDEFIYSFAKHLTKINSIKNANLEQQRTPYIVGAVKEIASELETFFKHVDGGKKVFHC